MEEFGNYIARYINGNTILSTIDRPRPVDDDDNEDEENEVLTLISAECK